MRASFQIIILVVFIFAAIFGVLVFSGAIPIGDKADEPGGLGTVVVWGTVKGERLSLALENFNAANPSFVVKYVEKSAESFDRNLLEALASGAGPDMLFLPEDLVFHYSNKLYPIPYQTYPLATFKNTFAGAGEVFLSSGGILALPLVVDPLLMYYNRSTLDANAVIYPPSSWDDLIALVPKLTKKDESNKISKSTLALGHFANVAHAKDILSALFMQTDNPIVSQKPNGSFTSDLDSGSAASVLRFYTDFADPAKSVYSWNKSFPNSVDVFSRGDLAFYFGFASELAALINRNPNQNFLPAPIPQLKGANFKLTGAHVLGVAVLASSRNLSTAFTSANLMAGTDFADRFAKALFLPPARRDLLAQKPLDAYSPFFYDSALYAKSWLDPSPKDTDAIFRSMIEGVLSNTFDPGDAVSDAHSKLNFLLVR